MSTTRVRRRVRLQRKDVWGNPIGAWVGIVWQSPNPLAYAGLDADPERALGPRRVWSARARITNSRCSPRGEAVSERDLATAARVVQAMRKVGMTQAELAYPDDGPRQLSDSRSS